MGLHGADVRSAGASTPQAPGHGAQARQPASASADSAGARGSASGLFDAESRYLPSGLEEAADAAASRTVQAAEALISPGGGNRAAAMEHASATAAALGSATGESVLGSAAHAPLEGAGLATAEEVDEDEDDEDGADLSNAVSGARHRPHAGGASSYDGAEGAEDEEAAEEGAEAAAGRRQSEEHGSDPTGSHSAGGPEQGLDPAADGTWTECLDEASGFPYYVRPGSDGQGDESRWADASDWHREADPETGFPYLCNVFTGETAWEHAEALATASASLQLVLGADGVATWGAAEGGAQDHGAGLPADDGRLEAAGDAFGGVGAGTGSPEAKRALACLEGADAERRLDGRDCDAAAYDTDDGDGNEDGADGGADALSGSDTTKPFGRTSRRLAEDFGATDPVPSPLVSPSRRTASGPAGFDTRSTTPDADSSEAGRWDHSPRAAAEAGPREWPAAGQQRSLASGVVAATPPVPPAGPPLSSASSASFDRREDPRQGPVPSEPDTPRSPAERAWRRPADGAFASSGAPADVRSALRVRAPDLHDSGVDRAATEGAATPLTMTARPGVRFSDDRMGAAGSARSHRRRRTQPAEPSRSASAASVADAAADAVAAPTGGRADAGGDGGRPPSRAQLPLDAPHGRRTKRASMPGALLDRSAALAREEDEQHGPASLHSPGHASFGGEVLYDALGRPVHPSRYMGGVTSAHGDYGSAHGHLGLRPSLAAEGEADGDDDADSLPRLRPARHHPALRSHQQGRLQHHGRVAGGHGAEGGPWGPSEARVRASSAPFAGPGTPSSRGSPAGQTPSHASYGSRASDGTPMAAPSPWSAPLPHGGAPHFADPQAMPPSPYAGWPSQFGPAHMAPGYPYGANGAPAPAHGAYPPMAIAYVQGPNGYPVPVHVPMMPGAFPPPHPGAPQAPYSPMPLASVGGGGLSPRDLPRPVARQPKSGRRRAIDRLGLTSVKERQRSSLGPGAAMRAAASPSAAGRIAGPAHEVSRRLDFGGAASSGREHDVDPDARLSSRAEQIRALATLLRASQSGRAGGAAGGKHRRSGSHRAARDGSGARRSHRGRGSEGSVSGSGSDSSLDSDASPFEGRRRGGSGRGGSSRRDRRPLRSSSGRHRGEAGARSRRRRRGRGGSGSSSSSYGTDDAASDLAKDDADGGWGISAALGSLFGGGAASAPAHVRKRGERRAAPGGSPTGRSGGGGGGGHATRAAAGHAREAEARAEEEEEEEDDDDGLDQAIADAGSRLQVGGVEVGFTLTERIGQLSGALGAVGTAAARALAASGVPMVDSFISAAHDGTGQLVAAIEGSGDEAEWGPGPGWAARPAGASGVPLQQQGAAVAALTDRPVLANPRHVRAASAAAGVLPVRRPAAEHATAPAGRDRLASDPVDADAVAEAGWSVLARQPRSTRAKRAAASRRVVPDAPPAAARRAVSAPETVAAEEPAPPPSQAFDDDRVTAEEAAEFDANVV